MLKKFFKFTVIGGAIVGSTSFIFPDHFTPITKIINVGVAGAQIYYVYKYKN